MKGRVAGFILWVMCAVVLLSMPEAFTAWDSSPAWSTRIYYDDLRFPASSVRIPTANPPANRTYNGGMVLEFEDQAVEGNEEIIYFNAQLPHSYKEGEDIEAHIHWLAEDDTSGNARFVMTYSWANINGTFPSESTLTADCSSAGAADGHVMCDLGDISGTGKTISSMLICSLKRNSSHANDTLDGKDALFLEADFHIPKNSLGSRQEYIK